jgi:hypothetical protein
MSKSAVEFFFENIRHKFDKDSELYSEIVTAYVAAKIIERDNVKEDFNAGNNNNYYDATGKAADKYYNDNYTN